MAQVRRRRTEAGTAEKDAVSVFREAVAPVVSGAENSREKHAKRPGLNPVCAYPSFSTHEPGYTLLSALSTPIRGAMHSFSLPTLHLGENSWEPSSGVAQEAEFFNT